MRLLLDTHTLAWWAEGSSDLPLAVRAAIDDPANTVFFSAVSAYELALKNKVGKWPSAPALLAELDTLPDRGFVAMPITVAHARLAGGLPLTHCDPFDRMLAAQALIDDLTIVSIDDALDQFGVRRLW